MVAILHFTSPSRLPPQLQVGVTPPSTTSRTRSVTLCHSPHHRRPMADSSPLGPLPSFFCSLCLYKHRWHPPRLRLSFSSSPEKERKRLPPPSRRPSLHHEYTLTLYLHGSSRASRGYLTPTVALAPWSLVHRTCMRHSSDHPFSSAHVCHVHNRHAASSSSRAGRGRLICGRRSVRRCTLVARWWDDCEGEVGGPRPSGRAQVARVLLLR